MLGYQPRQTVNQICRLLEAQGQIQRVVGPKGKLVNQLIGENAHRTSSTKTTSQATRVQKPLLPEKNRGRSLVPPALHRALVVIPCSKAKSLGGEATRESDTILDELPADLAKELDIARQEAAKRAAVDESTRVPAWQRYDGTLYRNHGREAIEDLMSKGTRVVVLSGGYGLVLATEPIGMYEGVLHPGWLPNKLLQRCPIAFAKKNGIHSVRAFTSATTSYRRVLQQIRWRDAGIDDALLLVPEKASGGLKRSPATIGEALDALSKGRLTSNWRSSYGLSLSLHYH